MLGEEKNLKDSKKDSIKDTSSLSVSYGATGSYPGLYSKTDKLITALYMVTDIIDKDEPLRNKLRTLGTEIISDMRSSPAEACPRIAEVMSFLGIACTLNIISEMNAGILKKEFEKLDQSIRESTGKISSFNKIVNLEGFFEDEGISSSLDKGRIKEGFRPPLSSGHLPLSRGRENSSKGHPTSLGVQKAGTLLNAIKGISGTHNFDLLKKQRRDDILNIVKILGGSATIKDIKDKVHTLPGQVGFLDSHSEKTLQRELVSMVSDGVLKKEGSKRWSKYFIK